jgi:hypothetical protein
MAADLMQSFMGKHVEKVVLAAAVAIFLGALGWFVIFTQSQEKLRSEVKRRVSDAKERMAKADINDAMSKEERVTLGLDQPPLTVPAFESMLKGLGARWDALTKFEENQPKTTIVETTVAKPRTLPSKIVPIEDLEVAVGRGTTSEPVPNPLAKLVASKGTLYDVAWAGVVGRMDLTEQLDVCLAGRADYQPVLISKVELQRRELKPDGTWSEWQAVPPSAPKAVLDKLPKFPANPQDKRAVGEWGSGIFTRQADVRRMPFYPLLASDPEGQTVRALAGPIQGVEQPLPPQPPAREEPPAAKGAEGAPEAPAAPAAEAPPPPKAAGANLPPWFQQTPTKEAGKPAEGPKAVTPAIAAKHVMATLWVVDGGVEPGKTYQYQMRPSIVNPIYGTRDAVDDKARWTLEITGEWSKSSKEVTIPPVNQFFFVGSFGGKPNLELHRWIFSQWVIVPSAQASIGAPVLYTKPRTKIRVPGGGTETKEVDVDLSPGILLVDIIRSFRYRPEGNPSAISTNILVYAESQGRLSQRIEWLDRQAANMARKGREAVIPTRPGEEAPLPPPGRTPPPPPPPTKPPAKK